MRELLGNIRLKHKTWMQASEVRDLMRNFRAYEDATGREGRGGGGQTVVLSVVCACVFCLFVCRFVFARLCISLWGSLCFVCSVVLVFVCLFV